MNQFIRCSIIFLATFLCILNFGCKKNDNPVHANPPPPTNSKHPITIVTPKAGDVWYRNYTYDINWKINGDSVGQSVFVSIQQGMNQPFEPLFTAQTDSLKRKLYVTLDTSSYCRIRIRGSATNWEFDTSGVFSIIENPYTFLYPRAGDTVYQQKPTNIIFRDHAPLNVSIDLSINGGTTWKEIIKPNENLKWMVDSQVSNDCVLRTRDANGKILSMSDCCFRIMDWYNLNFSITSPKEGDVLHQGLIISIQYINQTSIPIAFDFSSDDGNTWTQIISSNSSPEWFITSDPSDNCRLRMRTDDYSLSFTTGKFRIISDLDEFFPLKIGKVFQYQYSNTHYRPAYGTVTNFIYTYSAEIISSKIIGDSTLYTCRVMTKNIYPNKDSSLSYDYIKEYNYGLHFISTTMRPMSMIILYRYSDKSITELNDSYTSPDRQTGWSWNQKKGIGITSYSNWRKGVGMFESYNESWTLF